MEQLFFAGKAYLKINSLVKTPLHEFMAVERSGLWASGKGQLEKLSRAYNNNSAITIRLARNELSVPHELMLTKTQDPLTRSMVSVNQRLIP